MNFPHLNEAPATRRPKTAVVLIAMAIVVLAVGAASRWSRAERLQDDAAAQQLRTVAVISPATTDTTALSAPARIEAWSQAPIHARVDGYLKRWYRDIGQPVKAGELLAVVDAPDVDQALQQARAELVRARSDAAFAGATAERWRTLAASQTVSRQDADQRNADAAARQADASALQANVQRLEALQQYTRITAPFDGVVTARNTDVGALIGTGSNSEAPLFIVADVRRLRVYVNIPQRRVASLRIGDTAAVQVPEWPGETFPATIQSLAGAIDAQTGAMRVQLEVDNHDGRLLPGSFGTVQLSAGAQAAAANALPPSALIMGRNGVRVALVDDAGRVTLSNVTIVRDHGALVELGGSLAANARVINSPPDGIRDGDRVRVAAPEKKS